MFSSPSKILQLFFDKDICPVSLLLKYKLQGHLKVNINKYRLVSDQFCLSVSLKTSDNLGLSDVSKGRVIEREH